LNHTLLDWHALGMSEGQTDHRKLIDSSESTVERTIGNVPRGSNQSEKLEKTLSRGCGENILSVIMYREHVGTLGNGIEKKDRRELKKQEERYRRKKKISIGRLKTRNLRNQ
jgi:hypothetical protein